MRNWMWVVALGAAVMGCRPREESSSPIQQGRLYTDWLYGSQYEKLWDRFSPELRQTFGSVTDLASFAGWAITRLGRERGIVDERVDRADPYRVYSRTASFDGSRQQMLLEWSMADDGEVTGLVLRPAPDSAR